MGPSHDWKHHGRLPDPHHPHGPAAKLLILAKKLVRPFVRLYTDHVLNRQASSTLLLPPAAGERPESARLRVELQALRARCEVLERERAGRVG